VICARKRRRISYRNGAVPFKARRGAKWQWPATHGRPGRHNTSFLARGLQRPSSPEYRGTSGGHCGTTFRCLPDRAGWAGQEPTGAHASDVRTGKSRSWLSSVTGHQTSSINSAATRMAPGLGRPLRARPCGRQCAPSAGPWAATCRSRGVPRRCTVLAVWTERQRQCGSAAPIPNCEPS
jgi:hypothetical protein